MISWLMYAALLVDPRATRGEISAGVSAELRGGYAPVQAGAPSQASFLMLVVPNLDFRVRSRRAGVLTFGYSPRILYRLPNLLSVRRPLFLHQLSLVYGVALDRRWDMFVGTNASIGEIDYTAVPQLFSAMQGQVANADVLRFAIGDAAVQFTGQVAPRHRIGIAPSIGYRKALNNQPVDPDDDAPQLRTSFPDQVSGNLLLSYGYQATRLDEIRVLTYNGVTAFDPGATYLTDDLRLGWLRQIARNATAEIDAGVLSARRIQPDDDLAPGQRQPQLQRVLPVASARVGGRLRARARYRLDGTVGANLTGYFDAVRGTLAPRAGGTATLTATLPPRWSIGFIGSVFTAATQNPLHVDPTNDASAYQIESAILSQVPIRYQINDNAQVEFGAIFNVRTPHFLADDFGDTQLEAWGYVAFRIAGGTARGRREVATRSVGGGQGAATGSGGGGAR